MRRSEARRKYGGETGIECLKELDRSLVGWLMRGCRLVRRQDVKMNRGMGRGKEKG